MTQCKDIPDAPVLQFIKDLHGRWGTWYWYDGIENSVRAAMPDGPNLPDRLVLAKMAKLIGRGLVAGCPCGCRGDYQLTPDGAAFLGRVSGRKVPELGAKSTDTDQTTTDNEPDDSR